MCLLNAHSIKKYTGFHQEITKTFIKPALSAAVMGVVCFLIQYAVQSVLPFGRVCFAVCVIIAVPVGALIYFAAIIKLKVFTEEELTKIPKGNQISKEITFAVRIVRASIYKRKKKSRSAMIWAFCINSLIFGNNIAKGGLHYEEDQSIFDDIYGCDHSFVHLYVLSCILSK